MLNIHELWAAQGPCFCLQLRCKIVQDEILSWSCLSLLHESVFVQTVSQTQTPHYCRHCTDANSLMCCINLRTLAYISERSNLFKCLHFPPNKTKHTRVRSTHHIIHLHFSALIPVTTVYRRGQSHVTEWISTPGWTRRPQMSPGAATARGPRRWGPVSCLAAGPRPSGCLGSGPRWELFCICLDFDENSHY